MSITPSQQEISETWYAPLFQYMKENDEVIRAFACINANWDTQTRWGEPYNGGYWGDSRLQTNPWRCPLPGPSQIGPGKNCSVNSLMDYLSSCVVESW